jgi:hypothetical protein
MSSDDREPGSWPTLTRNIEPLPGGLADLRQRIANQGPPPRLWFAWTATALAFACLLIVAIRRSSPAPLRLAVAEGSAVVADSRLADSDKIVFYWVGSASASADKPVDPETLVAGRIAANEVEGREPSDR